MLGGGQVAVALRWLGLVSISVHELAHFCRCNESREVGRLEYRHTGDLVIGKFSLLVWLW